MHGTRRYSITTEAMKDETHNFKMLKLKYNNFSEHMTNSMTNLHLFLHVHEGWRKGSRKREVNVSTTFLEVTSWSPCGLSLITFHCNCNKALCLSSCVVPKAQLI